MKDTFASGLPLTQGERPKKPNLEKSLARLHRMVRERESRRYGNPTSNHIEEARRVTARICGERDD